MANRRYRNGAATDTSRASDRVALGRLNAFSAAAQIFQRKRAAVLTRENRTATPVWAASLRRQCKVKRISARRDLCGEFTGSALVTAGNQLNEGNQKVALLEHLLLFFGGFEGGIWCLLTDRHVMRTKHCTGNSSREDQPIPPGPICRAHRRTAFCGKETDRCPFKRASVQRDRPGHWCCLRETRGTSTTTTANQQQRSWHHPQTQTPIHDYVP